MKTHKTDERCLYLPGFEARGKWFVKLPCPFSVVPYYPLDVGTLAELLHVSPRTALRICKQESGIRHGELVYLQMCIFGYIPDPSAERGQWFIHAGVLRSHRLPGFELDLAGAVEFVLLRHQFSALQGDLANAKQQIRTLQGVIEDLTTPAPSNVIPFPRR